MCARKKRFNTESEAKKAMKRNKKHCFAGKLFYYKCETCYGYHLSRTNPDVFQRVSRFNELTRGL